MSQEEFSEWHDAILGLHHYSQWFQDRGGYIFSFLWLDSLREGQ